MYGIEDLYKYIEYGFLPFIRIIAFIVSAPVFGAEYISPKIKTILAMLIAFFYISTNPTMIDLSSIKMTDLLIFVFSEALVGIALGFMLRMLFSVFELAGNFSANGAGLSFAMSIDPQHGTQISTIGQIYTILGTLYFLTINGHLVAISVLIASFQTIPMGQFIHPENIKDILKFFNVIFVGAFLISLPMFMALMLSNLTFAVMTRASPQINVFAVGFPITIVLGIFILTLSLDNLPIIFNSILDKTSLIMESFAPKG